MPANRPETWGVLLDRLAYLFGGDPEARESAVDWLREAVERRYTVASLHDLTRGQRLVVFQKAMGVLWTLEDEPGDLAFVIGIRAIVARTFARYFDGVAVDGPPWRLDPTELDRPTRAAWAASADFAAVAGPSDAGLNMSPVSRKR